MRSRLACGRFVGFALLLGLAATQLGCKRLEELQKRSAERGKAPDAPPAPPLAISWAERKGTLEGGRETIEVLATKNDFSITFNGFPAGTKYEVGGKAGAIAEGSYSMAHVDIRDRIAQLALDRLKEVDFGFEMKLSLPDGRTGTTRLPPVYVDYALREMLELVENGPVNFGGEANDEHADDCLIWSNVMTLVPFGKCTTVQNIDFVAMAEVVETAKGNKLCTGYKQNDGKPARDITVLFKDTKVTVYDRRSGKIVKEESFAPDNSCPMFAMTSKDEATMDAYQNTKAIEAWLRKIPRY